MKNKDFPPIQVHVSYLAAMLIYQLIVIAVTWLPLKYNDTAKLHFLGVTSCAALAITISRLIKIITSKKQKESK